jgi:mRNA interferase RelE/StbE
MSSAVLQPDELLGVQQHAEARKRPGFESEFRPFEQLRSRLRIAWSVAESLYTNCEADDGPPPVANYYRRPPDVDGAAAEPTPPARGWAFYMTPSFQKDVAQLDRKLQGRILGALTDIFDEPCKARGDTVKPLQDDLKGYWRYRIGDYRLIYFPDVGRRLVALVSIAARSSAYEH